MTVAEQALLLFAVERGFLEDVELKKVAGFEVALLNYARNEYADLMKDIEDNPVYNDDVVGKLTDVLTKFKETQTF